MSSPIPLTIQANPIAFSIFLLAYIINSDARHLVSVPRFQAMLPSRTQLLSLSSSPSPSVIKMSY